MMTFFLAPTVRATGPVGGQFVGALMQRTRLSAWLLGAGVVTLLTGSALYWMFYAGIAWDAVGPHVTYGIGGISAILAFAVAFFFTRPTAARFAALGRVMASQGPAPAQAAERDALSARLRTLALVNSALVISATALMAVGRYL